MTRSDFERVFENIGSAIAILQRNDSKPMPEDIRELILEARHRLSKKDEYGRWTCIAIVDGLGLCRVQINIEPQEVALEP